MPDDGQYIYFSTQYADALVRFHHPLASDPTNYPADRGFWFGRLVDYPYDLQNFHADNGTRTGLQFWTKLVNDEIKISRYELTDIGAYTPISGTANVMVEVTAEIDYEYNSTDYSAVIKLEHYLRPTWVAYRTIYTQWDFAE